MSEPSLDPRVNAFSPTLADERLRGRVRAERFVAGFAARVVRPAVPMRGRPGEDAGFANELLHGESVRVFADENGWAWCQNDTDGYVGFVPGDALGPTNPEPTHRVTALRTFLYPGPDMKLPPVAALSLGARVALGETVETRGTPFRLVAGSDRAIVASHVAPLGDAPERDYVEVAERFLDVPYLWGGRTSLGLDCSALVQLSLMEAGIAAPRDSDMQRAQLGETLTEHDEPKRGDLVFWPGHVAILAGPDEIIHASGHHMAVVRESRAEAFARIGTKTPISAIKRLAGSV